MIQTIVFLFLFTLANSQDTISVQVTEEVLSDPIRHDFVSFSIETHCVLPLFTNAKDGSPKVSYRNLLSFLQQATSSNTKGVNIRIGGNSADESVYLPDLNTPLPTGDSYRITDADIEAMKLASTFGASLTIDLSLRNTSSKEALNYAQAIMTAFNGSKTIDAYEIGNEPDLFSRNGIRPSSYTYAQYQTDFEKVVSDVSKITGLPMPSIQGGTFCCGPFDSDAESYLKQYGSLLKSFSYHHYPLSVCSGSNVTIDDLLSPASSSLNQTNKHFLTWANYARSLGIPFYIGEGNSVSCHGQEGVSDAFASTLWVVDMLFTAAINNITRWNFHGCTGLDGYIYSPIQVDDTTGIASPRPIFYGLWAVIQAAANQAVVVKTNIVSSTNSQVVVWTTLDGHRIVVVVIHKDYKASGNATVSIDFTSNFGNLVAHIQRIVPLNGLVSSTGGVDFDGMTFEGSTDGTPQGQSRGEEQRLSVEGTVDVAVVPASVVLITVIKECKEC